MGRLNSDYRLVTTHDNLTLRRQHCRSKDTLQDKELVNI